MNQRCAICEGKENLLPVAFSRFRGALRRAGYSDSEYVCCCCAARVGGLFPADPENGHIEQGCGNCRKGIDGL